MRTDAGVRVRNRCSPRCDAPVRMLRAISTMSPTTADAVGSPACSAAEEHELAGVLALDEDGVKDISNRSQRVGLRDHRRMHAGADAALFFAPQLQAASSRNQGHGPLAHRSRRLGDSFSLDVSGNDPRIEGNRGQDGQLRSGVVALDVCAWIELRITKSLRPGQEPR